MACVPLSSARPSLAASGSGARPRRRSASPPGKPLASVKRLALANDHQRQMRQRSQIAARAHRALFRNDRMHARVEQRHQQLHKFHCGTPLKPLASTLARSSSMARDSPSESGWPHPACVAAHQVGLQLRQLSGGMRTSASLPNPVYTVDRLPCCQNILNQCTARSHTL
jgi:hypothetical protein